MKCPARATEVGCYERARKIADYCSTILASTDGLSVADQSEIRQARKINRFVQAVNAPWKIKDRSVARRIDERLQSWSVIGRVITDHAVRRDIHDVCAGERKPTRTHAIGNSDLARQERGIEHHVG